MKKYGWADLNSMSKFKRKRLLVALKKCEKIGCPDKKFRVAEDCFHCNECWQAAIKESLKHTN